MACFSYLCNSIIGSPIISLTYEKLDTCFRVFIYTSSPITTLGVIIPKDGHHLQTACCSLTSSSHENDLFHLSHWLPLLSHICCFFPKHCNYIFTCGVLKDTVLVSLLDLHISLFIVHFQSINVVTLFLLSFSLFLSSFAWVRIITAPNFQALVCF